MPQLNWPDIRRHRRQKALKHLASLEADFQTLDACVQLSTSKQHRLPTSLQQGIIAGILRAFSDNEFTPKLSGADQFSIGGLLLKHISIEAAERARDRIPLLQYRAIRRSFRELVAKINKDASLSHPETMTIDDDRGENNIMEPSPELETFCDIGEAREEVLPATMSNGGDTREGARPVDFVPGKERDATETTVVIDRPRKKGRKRKNRDVVTQTREEDNVMEPSPELQTFGDIGDAGEAIRPATISNGGDTHERARPADFFPDQERDATETAVAIDRPRKKGRKRKNRDGAEQVKTGDYTIAQGDHAEVMGNQHTAEVDVHTTHAETDDHGNPGDLLRLFEEIEAQRKHICVQLQDIENGQLEENTMWNAADELLEAEEKVQEYVMMENRADAEPLEGDTLINDPNDELERPKDQIDNQTRKDSTERFQQAREEKKEVKGADAFSIITFNIEHQAVVNHLNAMDSDDVLHFLSSSLETMRSSGHDVPDSVKFTNAMLLSTGDVEVYAHAGSKEASERLSRIRGWNFEFEKAISVPAKAYAVETHRIRFDSLNMQTRNHKAETIRELLEENLRFIDPLRRVDDIQNIRWCNNGNKRLSSLVIEFRTAQQANKVLDLGMYIRGKHCKCKFVDQKPRRCGKCQAFGHSEDSCSSERQCGRCTLNHATLACTSTLRPCANCHGPHEAKDRFCPAKKAYWQRLRYTDPSSPVSITALEEPATEPQHRSASLEPPSPNPTLTTEHSEGETKVVQEEALPTIDPVREHNPGRAVTPRQISIAAHSQHEPYIKAEDGELTEEIDLAQSPPDLTAIQKGLDDLLKQFNDLRTKLEQPSIPQTPPPQGTKREADEMLKGEPSSPSGRKRAQHGPQNADEHPVPNHNPLPANLDIPLYDVSVPGQQPMARQVFLGTRQT